MDCMEDSAPPQKLDANWDSECCKASTSWIEGLTLLDALSNRYHFWELPLVLEMRDLSHAENVFQRTKSVGSVLPLKDGCS